MGNSDREIFYGKIDELRKKHVEKPLTKKTSKRKSNMENISKGSKFIKQLH